MRKESPLHERVLTYVFTLPKLCEAKVLGRWELDDERLNVREFYYTPLWVTAFNALPDPEPGASLSRRVAAGDQVSGFLDNFVSGKPVATLERPIGFASKPMFRRMSKPDVAVVEMRTWDSRTFGFFARRNIFVGVTLLETGFAKRNNLYRANAMIVHRLMARILPEWLDQTTDVSHLVTD